MVAGRHGLHGAPGLAAVTLSKHAHGRERAIVLPQVVPGAAALEAVLMSVPSEVGLCLVLSDV